MTYAACTGRAVGLHSIMTGVAPLSNVESQTSAQSLVMTGIGGTSTLFASVLGSAFYLLMSDWLSALWPRWLMLLGVLLMVVSLAMQGGLWGLGEQLWRLVRRPEVGR